MFITVEVKALVTLSVEEEVVTVPGTGVIIAAIHVFIARTAISRVVFGTVVGQVDRVSLEARSVY